MMLERDANAEDEEKKWGTCKFKYLIQITNLWRKLDSKQIWNYFSSTHYVTIEDVIYV